MGPKTKDSEVIQSAGVLVTCGNKVLLLKSYRDFDLPKGKIEKGETEEQAARRELREETGIDNVTFSSLVPLKINYPLKNPKKKKIVYIFFGEVPTETVILSREHQGYKWVTIEEAIRLLPERFIELQQFLSRKAS